MTRNFARKNIATEIYPSPLDLHLSTVNQRADLHENWKIKYAESLAALPNPARKTKNGAYIDTVTAYLAWNALISSAQYKFNLSNQADWIDTHKDIHPMADKKSLSERDICSKYITPG